MDGRTDGRTDGRVDGRTDGWTGRKCEMQEWVFGLHTDKAGYIRPIPIRHGILPTHVRFMRQILSDSGEEMVLGRVVVPRV
jgi:hypothetical protein